MENKDTVPRLKCGSRTISYKHIAMVLCVIQSSAIVLFMRSSLQPAPGQKSFVKTTAVVMAEAFKIVASALLLGYERQDGLFNLIGHLKEECIDNWRSTILLAIPAGLYTLQNNLLFIALQNLNGATYQVTYQLKILTTALFSMCLLNKQISMIQWISLLLLTGGVACVQAGASTSSGNEKGNSTIGLTAVLTACFTSAFAGVYLEKIVKTTKQSVWLRNVQLSSFSIILGLIGAYTNDGDVIASEGFFQGYTGVVWIVIFLNGLGGIIIAAVIKYADNILKSFALAISILVTGMISYFFMEDFEVTTHFLFGAPIVLMATMLYQSELDVVGLLHNMMTMVITDKQRKHSDLDTITTL
eukprot:m.129679 g.129679  ORF g.129679 m.129679 type:complete len:358 (+) comp29416_c0_seq1:349-1422(+)